MGSEQIWRVDCIVGARPNFVKIAPILRALRGRRRFAPRLIHTGQHYDVAMNSVFFQELAIPAPDVNLEVGSGTGTEQTARSASMTPPPGMGGPMGGGRPGGGGGGVRVGR